VLIPKENRKDLRDIPRRVLKTTRVVLVEHMDQVLREALALNDADEFFGHRERPLEYVGGVLVDPNQPAGEAGEPSSVPSPTVEPPGAQQ
jgi:ATP-dependent Lon protease